MTAKRTSHTVALAAVCVIGLSAADAAAQYRGDQGGGSLDRSDEGPFYGGEELCISRPVDGYAIATTRRRARSNAFSRWEDAAFERLREELERRIGPGAVQFVRRNATFGEIEGLLLNADAVVVRDLEEIGGSVRCEAERSVTLQWECSVRAGACAPVFLRSP